MTAHTVEIVLDCVLVPAAIVLAHIAWTEPGKVAATPDSVAAARIMLLIYRAEIENATSGLIARWRARRRGRRLYERMIGPQEQMNFEGQFSAVEEKFTQTVHELFTEHGRTLPKSFLTATTYDGEVVAEYRETQFRN